MHYAWMPGLADPARDPAVRLPGSVGKEGMVIVLGTPWKIQW